MGAEDDSMLKMKVERSSRGRGEKKGAHGGRRDLLVTVPNVESAESRLKPPVVNSTQRRKIVLSQNKTGIKPGDFPALYSSSSVNSLSSWWCSKTGLFKVTLAYRLNF